MKNSDIVCKADLDKWKSDKSNRQIEDNKNDENDNFEEAKVWALNQKQSFMNT